MFNLTDRAYKALKNVLDKEQNTDESLYIRLSMGIGWGGPKLQLSLEEQPITDDRTYTFDELKVLIHEKDFVYFDHTKLDYVTDLLGSNQYKLIRV